MLPLAVCLGQRRPRVFQWRRMCGASSAARSCGKKSLPQAITGRIEIEAPRGKFTGAVIMRDYGGVMVTTRHTAIVTGANHGIGASTAEALARRGCAVLCSYLRAGGRDEPGTSQPSRDHRAQDAAAVIARIRDHGDTAAAVEADLSDPATPALLFDTAEGHFGPVDILVNNATGWLADTFAPASTDRLGRSLRAVTAQTWTRQFTVDAMGAAALITANVLRLR